MRWYFYLKLLPWAALIYLLVTFVYNSPNKELADGDTQPLYDGMNGDVAPHTHPPKRLIKHPHIIGLYAPSIMTPKSPTSVMNPHNFKYIINNADICNTNKVLALIFVHSSPEHDKERRVIRNTWGSVKQYGIYQIRIVFLLAKPLTRLTQKHVLSESKKHGDIVQEDFIDSYRNLTNKHIMGLKWIKTFCRQAQFIVKVDEDTFVNVFHLVKFLTKDYVRITQNKTFYCSVFWNQGPRRSRDDKWYVTKKEYPLERYPPYCEGFAYIIRQNNVAPLYEASLSTPMYWIDDVYITGILAKKIGATHKPFNTNYGFANMKASVAQKDKITKLIFVLAKYHYVQKEADWRSIWSASKTFSGTQSVKVKS